MYLMTLSDRYQTLDSQIRKSKSLPIRRINHVKSK